MITFSEFKQVELRIAKIKSVRHHPDATKLLILGVDVGGAERQLVAGLKGYYEPEELIGKTIVVVTNLEPAELRGVKSEGMLLAAQDGSVVSLLTVDKPVAPGSAVM